MLALEEQLMEEVSAERRIVLAGGHALDRRLDGARERTSFRFCSASSSASIPTCTSRGSIWDTQMVIDRASPSASSRSAWSAPARRHRSLRVRATRSRTRSCSAVPPGHPAADGTIFGRGPEAEKPSSSCRRAQVSARSMEEELRHAVSAFAGVEAQARARPAGVDQERGRRGLWGFLHLQDLRSKANWPPGRLAGPRRSEGIERQPGRSTSCGSATGAR